MKSVFKTLFVLATLSACTSPSKTPPVDADASLILAHKYWVSKPFNDALFAKSIIDTLGYVSCSELVFLQKDTLVLTSCLSDAGLGIFKITSPTSLEIAFEGFDGKPCAARFDEKTGVLHVDPPGGIESGWPTEFIAQDGIDVNSIDNVTVSLARKRLAGSYSILPEKGKMAITSMLELRADGTQVGFGDFDSYEPWPSGIGAGQIQNPPLNLMYLVKKDEGLVDPIAVGWQVRGDTLRIWNTTNLASDVDMPEYKITGLQGTYLKMK